MFTKIVAAIKNREGKIPAAIYFLVKKILQFNVPALRIIYVPLFVLFSLSRRVMVYILQKIFFEPMFKVNCVKIGKSFRIDKGFPFFQPGLQMEFGDHVVIDGKNSFVTSSVAKRPRLCVGDNTYIGYGATISVGKQVVIGRDCLIAGGTFICDNNGHPVDPARRHERVGDDEVEPVEIGKNVWICNNAFIGKGVHIGDGAIVAAHSVVVEDVEANTIVSGIPARIVRRIGNRQ